MNKICDLHTHSVFSDGTLTPTELIDTALSKNLAAIALCDHNTIMRHTDSVNLYPPLTAKISMQWQVWNFQRIMMGKNCTSSDFS